MLNIDDNPGVIRRKRQEAIDKLLCKGGYTWNETVNRCIPTGGFNKKPKDPGNPAPDPENPAPTADDAVKMEVAKRKSK